MFDLTFHILEVIHNTKNVWHFICKKAYTVSHWFTCKVFRLKKEGSLWLCCACRGAFATSTVATAAAALFAGVRNFCTAFRTLFALLAPLRGPCEWWPWWRRRHTVQQAHGWQRSVEVGCKSRQATSKRWKPFAGLEKQTVWLRRYMRTSKAATGEAHRARARQGWCFFRPATMATRT